MNTALYILRVVQLGLSICELEYLDMGTVLDVFTEANNDSYDYPQKATQNDIDRL